MSYNTPKITSTDSSVTVTYGSNIDLTGAGGTVINPKQSISMVDDFFVYAAGSNIFESELGWYPYSASSSLPWVPVAPLSGANPGVVANVAFASGDNALFLGTSTSTLVPQIVLGSGAVSCNWVVRINTASTGTNRYILRLGFGDTFIGDQANGCYFEYTDNVNSGQWVTKTAQASSRTATNTAVSTTSAFANFGISVNAGGTSVVFTINGTTVRTETATIPTAAITPFIQITRSLGTIAASSVYVDLFYLSESLTASR